MAIEVSESAVPLMVQEYAAFINRVRRDLGMGPLDLSDFSVDDAGRVTFRIPVVPEPAVVAAADGCDVVGEIDLDSILKDRPLELWDPES